MTPQHTLTDVQQRQIRAYCRQSITRIPDGKNGQHMVYRTRDGLHYFGFQFERQGDGTWRIYIDWPIDYGPRSDDPHSTHRFRDGDRRFICWSDPIHSPRGAERVAAEWAENTQRYVLHGTPF